MLANVACPNCRHKYWLEEAEMGSKQTCPNCQAEFFAGASVAGASPAQSRPAAQDSYAKTMLSGAPPSISYHCPRCNAVLEASATEVGAKKNCPKCSQRHQVPVQARQEPAAVPNLNKTMLAGSEPIVAKRPPIKYNCPNCRAPLEAAAELGGTKANCSACSQRLQIPAAPPIAGGINKTMLASEGGGIAPTRAPQGFATAGSAPVAGPGATATATATLPVANPWGKLVTPQNMIIAFLLVLVLIYVVPAFSRGGKFADTDAQARNQLELEKLKAEIEGRRADMDRQMKTQADVSRQMEDMERRRRDQEAKYQDDQRKIREDDDEDSRRRRTAKLKQDQEQRERERTDMERKNKELLEETARKLDDAKKALEASQNQQKTIQAAPPPVVMYPPYSPYYYRPWWY